MRILIVSRYKEQFSGNVLPFVLEQGQALSEAGNIVEYFPIKGSYLNVLPLLKVISEFKPDIIHAHYGLSGVTAILQNKVPVVTTFHNGETLSWPINFITSLFSLRAKHIIYVAQHIYEKCIFKRKDRYSILPCGVNLDEIQIMEFTQARKELGFDPDKKYILFGGAFDNLRKNYPLLKEAIELLDNKDQIVCLEMKGLSRQQITKLMCACDVFALPSKSEGSPQALKEAMACNCPIVATDVADIKHLLGDLKGHYVCPSDSNCLSIALSQALNLCTRTSGRNRIFELGLNNELIITKIIDIYYQIIKTR